MSNESETIRRLEGLVNHLMARVAHLEDQRGRMFIADMANAGFTTRAMIEMKPKADGSELEVLENGRTVSGPTDAGVFLQIPGLTSGQTVLMGFTLGSNTAYVPITRQLRFGKIVTVPDCKNYCIVKPSKLDGTLLSDKLVNIAPTLGSCDTTASGFCYEVGDVIGYEEMPDDPTQGLQVGVFHKLSMGYQCGEAEGGPTNLAHIDNLNRIEPYLTDFFIGSSSDCGGTFTNLAQLNWRGFIITGGYGGTVSDTIGATNTAGTGGVKVLSFDGAISSSLAAYGTNAAKINFEITGATTSANVPTLGGSPCLDNSLPKSAKIQAYFPTGVTIDASDPEAITVVCNEDGTITLTYPTIRCLVPFPV